MKILLLPLLLASALSVSAQFTPIAEDFSTSGNLVGSTPDSGVGTWAQISNSSPALSVSSGSLGLAASSGESAQLNFASSNLSSGTIYMGWEQAVRYEFALSLLSLLASLIVSLLEITQSTKALELELGDIEEPERSGFFSELIKKKEE